MLRLAVAICAAIARAPGAGLLAARAPLLALTMPGAGHAPRAHAPRAPTPRTPSRMPRLDAEQPSNDAAAKPRRRRRRGRRRRGGKRRRQRKDRRRHRRPRGRRRGGVVGARAEARRRQAQARCHEEGGDAGKGDEAQGEPRGGAAAHGRRTAAAANRPRSRKWPCRTRPTRRSAACVGIVDRSSPVARSYLGTCGKRTRAERSRCHMVCLWRTPSRRWNDV